MSRHYNGQHPERLRKAPRKFGKLEDVEVLRNRQLGRLERTGSPFPTASEDEEREAA